MAAPARSAAIQIVRPTESHKSEQPEKVKKDATQRLCRNVLIYGSCRFQDQGCAYYHPPPGTDPTAPPPISTQTPSTPNAKSTSSPAPVTPKTQLNPAAGVFNTPTQTPEPKALSVAHLSAPVFVPKSSVDSPSASSTPAPSEWANAVPFTPPVSAGAGPTAETHPLAQQLRPSPSQPGLIPPPMGFDESGGMGFDHADGVFLGTAAPQQRRVPDHHLYVSPMPHVAGRQPMHSFFVPDDLRRMIQARHEATYANPGVSLGLPAEVHVYHNLVPLGNPNPPVSRMFHHPAPVYRANSTVDGHAYCLRRIEGYKLSNEAAFSAVETWRQIRHANIVGLREAFTTKAFNDNSLVMVYEFHPDSTTVADEWLNPDAINRRRQTGQPIPERIIWSYVIQIANALKAVHTAGLAVRCLDATKILITGKNRIRVNGVGIVDVLAFENQTPMPMFQQEDLLAFGQLILALCSDYVQPGQHIASSLEIIGRTYSPDLKNLIAYLLGKPAALKTIDEVLRLAGPRILNELDALQSYCDVLESDLGAEIENGRIARMLIKLGFINERPEFDMDPQWSESGDRYVLKLFRDYVFHQVGPDRKPVLDLSHVLTTLNKLDAGARSREKVMLVSRDSQSCLVVEYRDIYKCIESAYNELRGTGRR